MKGLLFVRRQADFDDFLHAGCAHLDRHAHVQVVDAVLAGQPGGAWKDSFFVPHNGRHHFGNGGSGRVEGAARFEVSDNLGAAVPRAFDQAFDDGFVEQFRQRNAGHGRVAGQRHHGIAVAAQNEGGHVFHGYVQFSRDEITKPRGIKNARHANDTSGRKLRNFQRHVSHCVEGIRHHDNNGVGRCFFDAFADRAHDVRVRGKQVVPAHAGLARKPGGNDDNVGSGQAAGIARTRNPGIEAVNRRRLSKIQGFTLWNALGDVQQDQFAGEFPLRNMLSGGRSHVAGANHCDLQCWATPPWEKR